MNHTKKLKAIVLLVLLCMCSCGEENKAMIIISPKNKTNIELATNVYNDSQLLNIINESSSLEELNKKYPIECIREVNGYYRVSYLGERKVAVLLFDNSKQIKLGRIYNTSLNKKDYDMLRVGESLSTVKALDPGGEYLFLVTGRNDIPKESSHYTKDGYLITIVYDSLNIIKDIMVELI